jgi:hypothetical protein
MVIVPRLLDFLGYYPHLAIIPIDSGYQSASMSDTLEGNRHPPLGGGFSPWMGVTGQNWLGGERSCLSCSGKAGGLKKSGLRQ